MRYQAVQQEINDSGKALCPAAGVRSFFEPLVIPSLCTRREKWTKRRNRIYCHPFPEVNGGIAQLVERLVRKDFWGFCDWSGLLWTERDGYHRDE